MKGDEEHKEQIILLQQIMALQDVAYGGPYGTWWQRLIPGVCKHKNIRCTHGDEIIARNWRRQVCLICGRALRGPLPVYCFFSPEGKAHSIYVYER